MEISVIPNEFRVRVFLDTNILVYLVDDTFRNLSSAVNFLKNCPFVEIYTSEYALLEFIEVRKEEHYLRKLVEGNGSGVKLNLSSAYKYRKSFNAPELSFDTVKEDIRRNVLSEKEDLVTKYNLTVNKMQDNFNSSVDICLNSKISIYDSLIISTSIYPQEADVVWTHDGQFNEAYKDTSIDNIFTTILSKKKPDLQRIKSVSTINLTDNNNIRIEQDIHKGIANFLIPFIRDKNEIFFLGNTFRHEEAMDNIVCFTLEPNKILNKEMYFVIIDRDLSNIFTSQKISEFRTENRNAIQNFPFLATENTKISFRWTGNGDINQVKQAHNLVFISPFE